MQAPLWLQMAQSQWHPPPLISLFLFLFLSLSFPSSLENPSPQFSCKPPHDCYPFCNSSLPTKIRAQDLLSRLFLSDKILQLSNGAASIPHLGIPAYEWWSESLHGLAPNGPGVTFNGSVTSATIFPQVILSTSSFNSSLWFSLASSIGDEARAMHNVGQAGLTFWAPNINIFRDPRWGRGQETCGEDPLVASVYAVEYVRGFQGEPEFEGLDDELMRDKRILIPRDSKLKLSACCKHFTAYDLENAENVTRYTFNAKVSKQDLEDTYQPPFKSCIQDGHASCLMCSYNQLNGIPSCARYDLLTQTARNEWGFEGYITSDCDAVAVIYEDQRYAPSPEDAVADVLKAGMDINCGTYLLRYTAFAVEQGKVVESDIDRALLNLFSVQIRLGLFDGFPNKQRFAGLGPNDVCNAKHRKLALEATRQGIVLLKNTKSFLPLTKSKVSSMAIIGPAAHNASLLNGDYSGTPCNPTTLFEGLRTYVKNTAYSLGCLDIACESSDGFGEAIDVAKTADIVAVVAGLDLTQETEDHDRVSLILPGKQRGLITSIAHASKGPVILILVGGGPIDVSFTKEDPRIASILWIGYPGETGGEAVAEVLFGDVNPGGRLPVTWYPESFTSVPMTDMNMRPDPSRGYPGRTYRFYTGEVVYPFGHGLSYSEFSYEFLSLPKFLSVPKVELLSSTPDTLRTNQVDYIYIEEVETCEALRFYVRVSVLNDGGMDGSHVVLLYSKSPARISGAPKKQLIGFKRVHTKSKQPTEAVFFVNPCENLSNVNEHGERVLEIGNHVLMVGNVEHLMVVGS
ncbi:probable beta-D-xylosidase 6 [Amborella trichopoda]|uniref:Fibronectin type III-like domain-containing protein n=1 Tax=Amborella trichopoda TaxID=13333 RepID=W1PX44_AMBTC|nr:probable beta-D-xylosidase 6 [Amborella trichopoda]ERN11975.1 hypothetical protein AMTR_s00184p00056440 [Amborella trichopoda]|eukprot:XP_006850394.1 probable beta-D-xylosidase 6 [Amborella trichopoda]